MTRRLLAAPCAALALLLAPRAFAAPAVPPDGDVVQAYQYLVARLVSLQQEQQDVQAAGMRWNELAHRPADDVAALDPEPELVVSDAWIAVDAKSCTTLEVPRIDGRWWSVQAVNGWGDTVALVSRRAFPKEPHGRFALCAKGASAALPAGVRRLDVPGAKTRVRVRIERGADAAEAVRLQQAFRLAATGAPRIAPAPRAVPFTSDALPGVEAFDDFDPLLASDPDVAPGMEALQQKVRAVGVAARYPKPRERLEHVIRTQAIPQLLEAARAIGPVANGWSRAGASGSDGADFGARSARALAGIRPSPDEIALYRATRDAGGAPLDGAHRYTLTFRKDALPAAHASDLWSLVALDAATRRVIPNALGRYAIGDASAPTPGDDGSLTLWVAATAPPDAPPGNWLPTLPGQPFELRLRFYGASPDARAGRASPPPLVRLE